MHCPACGNNQAYIGFSSIDCPNKICRNFKGSEPKSPTTIVAPPPTKPLPPMPIAQAAPASPGPTISASPTGIATLTLAVTFQTSILSNSVYISFVADGDPGIANKTVEFLWSVAGMNTPRICTLSAKNTYHVTGIDADGRTTYTTHWRCLLDGIQPNDPWTLDARIY